jgi:hypothetical protein
MIRKKGNSVKLGLLLGVLLPLFVMLLFYLFKFSDYPLQHFREQLFEMKLISKYMSICVYPNLLLFFIFIWKDRLLSARGVLLATILLAIGVFIIKFSP